MTKYALHGGYPKEKNKRNDAFFAEMASDVPEGGMLLMVYFAIMRSEDEIEEISNRNRERMQQYTGTKEFSVVIANKNDFVKQLKEADVLYIHGGDTEKLKKTLDTFPEFVDLLHNKVVYGSSAGAYVLSKYFFTNSLGVVMEGFGCLPIRTVCHYESNIHPVPEGVDPLTEINKYDNSLELVLLRDYEWRVFNV